MDIPKQCIFSGSTENLNTCMTVTLDGGERVEAWISDEYAESATPSKVKQAVIEFCEKQEGKQEEIAKLMAQAKALGLELAPVGAPAPVAPAPAPAIATRPRQSQQSQQVLTENFTPDDPNNRVIDGRVADSRHVQANVTGSVAAMGGHVSGSGSEYAITSQDKPSEDLKEGEVAEIGVVRGRLGSLVAIPVKRKGKTGETRVSVVDTGGDAGLQKRFKQMANDEPPDFVHSGYQVRTVNCGPCRGTGKVMGGKKVCPKCGGAGMYDA